MPYQVIIPKPVKKQLDAIPNKTRQRIIEKIKLLADNPRIALAGADTPKTTDSTLIPPPENASKFKVS